MSSSQKPLVLVTGASGFIAAHVLHSFLERGYRVRGTVRSEASAEGVRRTHASYRDTLEIVAIGDMASGNPWAPSLFEGVSIVAHTATAFDFAAKTPEDRLRLTIDPTISGMIDILAAIKKHAPQVHRVVYLSSVVSIVDFAKGTKASLKYTEDDWNPVTREQGATESFVAYMASKTLAERAAWDFVEKEKPSFALTTLCPPVVVGPLLQHDASIAKLNLSSSFVWPYLSGQLEKPAPADMMPTFVHVKDVADAHVFAAEKDAAKNRRYITSAGQFQWTDVARLYRQHFPELGTRVPDPDATPRESGLDDLVNTRSVTELGIKYRGFEETFLDAAKSLLSLK